MAAIPPSQFQQELQTNPEFQGFFKQFAEQSWETQVKASWNQSASLMEYVNGVKYILATTRTGYVIQSEEDWKDAKQTGFWISKDFRQVKDDKTAKTQMAVQRLFGEINTLIRWKKGDQQMQENPRGSSAAPSYRNEPANSLASQLAVPLGHAPK